MKSTARCSKGEKKQAIKENPPLGEYSKEAGAPLLPRSSVLGDHIALSDECFIITTPHLAKGFGPQRWQLLCFRMRHGYDNPGAIQKGALLLPE